MKGMFCMSINCIALGKRICFYRLKFNITQEKLAALTNCSREYIAYLESGTKTPSLPTLIDLANVLHFVINFLPSALHHRPCVDFIFQNPKHLNRLPLCMNASFEPTMVIQTAQPFILAGG